jgi:hypothetical protein
LIYRRWLANPIGQLDGEVAHIDDVVTIESARRILHEIGREAEQLAYTTGLAPHYGDDWWFLCQHAFAQMEVGQLELARRNIDRSLELNPTPAHARM